MLNFRTGVEVEEHNFRFGTGEIAKTYLKGWFWVDLLSAFPYEAIIQDDNKERLPKMIRVLRLSKVMISFSRPQPLALTYTHATRLALSLLYARSCMHQRCDLALVRHLCATKIARAAAHASLRLSPPLSVALFPGSSFVSSVWCASCASCA